MSVEVTGLVAAILLGIFQVILASQALTFQRGFKWNMSSREQDVPPATGLAGRLDRALQNFKETFPLFASAILLALVTQKTSSYSALGAQVYILARVAYVPVYAAGIQGLRSLVWLTSMAGLALVCFSLVST